MKLNLNKLKLYCILHNVKNINDVPCCGNCQHFNWGENDCLWGEKSIEYSVHTKISNDTIIKEFKIGRGYKYYSYLCNSWEKKR